MLFELFIASFLALLLLRHLQLRHEARSGASARLVWCPPSAPGLSDRRRRLADRLADIVSRCPRLLRPSYTPPVFAADGWSNMALYLAKSWLAGRRAGGRYRKQHVRCPDGGAVRVDWSDDPVTRGLPDTAPIVVFIHGVAGRTGRCLVPPY